MTDPSSNETPPYERPVRFWALLLLLLCAAAGWRAWHLTTPSLDHDEVYEVVHQSADLEELVNRSDRFPPLYRWLTGNLLAATDYDLGIRWFSLVVGTLTLLPLALLARDIAGPRAGIVAALLLGVSANHVLLSQKGRGYALMLFFCAWMLLAAWRLRKSDRLADWLLLLVSAWLAIATHYFAGLLLLLLGGMLLIEKRGASRVRALLAAAGMVVLAVPLLICLQVDLAESGEFYLNPVPFDKENYAYTYLVQLTGGTLGPSMSELRERVSIGETRQAILSMLPWGLLAMLPVGVLSLSAWQRLAPGARAWLLVLLLAPPWLLLLSIPLLPTGYNFRYLAWIVLPLTVWLAVGATIDRRRPIATLATLLLIVVGLGSTLNRHYVARYAEDDFHPVVALIEEQNQGDLPPAVLVSSHYYGQGVFYTLPHDWPHASLLARPDQPSDWETALPAFADHLDGQQVVWLVVHWVPQGHPSQKIYSKLVDRLEAELVERVGSNILVFRTTIEKLR